MKIILPVLMFFCLNAHSQDPDIIIGKWLKVNKEDLIIEVFKANGVYKGKINWSKDNSKPVGFIMLDNLKYNQKANRWDGGEIHDPRSGRTYNGSVTLRPDGTILVTGKMFMFKRSRIFKRVE